MAESGRTNGFADLYVDAHVHIYPFMSVEAMLDAAERNLFERQSERPSERFGVLLVADPDGVNGYERLVAGKEGERWQREAANGGSVTFRRPEGAAITAIRGQQLITREGLEVLGIGYRGRVASGRSLKEIVERVRDAGGLAILAWGVGKWLGRRGRALDELIESEGGSPDVMLADNAGRPGFWPVPQFQTAAARGMRVLAGTDPLPLAGEERRVGSYGFRIAACPKDGETPARALRRALASPEVAVEIVGKTMAVGDVVGHQLRLKLARRRRQGGRS